LAGLILRDRSEAEIVSKDEGLLTEAKNKRAAE
jgi:hypothetical protein